VVNHDREAEMATLKMRRPELELIKQAAERLAYRTNSTFVLNDGALDDVDATDDQPGAESDDKKVVNFD